MPNKKRANKKKKKKKQQQPTTATANNANTSSGVPLTAENAGLLFSEPVPQPEETEDPVSPEEKRMHADKFKTLGNEAFKSKDYKKAVRHFSNAISWDPSNHVYFSNRSASCIYCGKFKQALRDALKCVQLKPRWPKGYSRLGTAQFYLKNYKAALAALKQGLTLDPKNAGMKTMLAKAEELSAKDVEREATQKVRKTGWMGGGWNCGGGGDGEIKEKVGQ